jgi:hypothetical protein
MRNLAVEQGGGGTDLVVHEDRGMVLSNTPEIRNDEKTCQGWSFKKDVIYQEDAQQVDSEVEEQGTLTLYKVKKGK